VRQQLRPKAYYNDTGRPSVDPELMIRMLIVGYCCGIRHERLALRGLVQREARALQSQIIDLDQNSGPRAD
jgi:transposase